MLLPSIHLGRVVHKYFTPPFLFEGWRASTSSSWHSRWCNMPSQDHLLRPRQVTLMATPWDIGPLGHLPDPECWEHLPSQLSTAVLLHGSRRSIRLQYCMPTTPPGSAYHSWSTARINTVARMNWSIEEASSLDNPTQAP